MVSLPHHGDRWIYIHGFCDWKWLWHGCHNFRKVTAIYLNVLRDYFHLRQGRECKKNITTVFVDTRLSKTKHPRKRFQNFRQSCMLSTDRIEIHQSQPLVWPSDLDNTHDWRKFWKHFRGCFLFESRVSTKTVVNPFLPKEVRQTVQISFFNMLKTNTPCHHTAVLFEWLHLSSTA